MMKDWLVRYEGHTAADGQEDPSAAAAPTSHNVVRMELIGCVAVEMAIRNMPFRGLRELRLSDIEVGACNWPRRCCSIFVAGRSLGLSSLPCLPTWPSAEPSVWTSFSLVSLSSPLCATRSSASTQCQG